MCVACLKNTQWIPGFSMFACALRSIIAGRLNEVKRDLTRKTIFIALLSLLFGAACGAPPAHRQAACDSHGAWSEPLQLGDSTEVLAFLSLVAQDSTIIVAGSTFPGFGDGKRHGYLIRPLGREGFYANLPYTEPPFPFFATTALDAGGNLHLVWSAPPDSAGHPITSLFHSRYENERRTERELIYQYAPGFHWEGYSPKDVIVDDKGTLHLVLQNFHTYDREGTFQYLRSDQNGWQVNDTGLEGGEPSLAVAPSGDIYMTFLNAWLPENARRGDYDENSIFFTVSKDRGKTWEEPILVSRSGVLAGNKPGITLLPSGIHIIWMKEADEQGTKHVLWHARSEDQGETWSDPLEIGSEVKGHITMFQTVAPPDDCLHLVFERESHFGSFDQQLYYARWDGQTWTTPETLFSETYSLQFALAATQDGTFHLAWMQRPSRNWLSAAYPIPSPGDWPQQVYSYSRPR